MIGSTDKSGEICDNYEKKDNRIKVIHKKNGGLSDARNCGINQASGDYIGFVDSDDFIKEDMYDILYKELKKNDADIAGCDYYLYTDKYTKKSDKRQNNTYVMNTEEALIQMNLMTGFGLAAWNKLYKRNLFNDIQFPKGKINEDWFIMYKLLEKSNNIVYTTEAKYFYRQRDNSITKSHKVNFTPIEAAREVWNFTENKYPKAEKYAEMAYINACLGVYNSMLMDYKYKNELKKYYHEVRKYYKDVLNLKDIRYYKKAQIWMMCNCNFVYNIIMKIKLNARGY